MIRFAHDRTLERRQKRVRGTYDFEGYRGIERFHGNQDRPKAISAPLSLTLDKRSSWAAREIVSLVKDEIAS